MITTDKQLSPGEEAERVLAEAELLYANTEVEQALDNLAASIERELHDRNPLILCLMLGAVVVTGRLLLRLNFPLQLEYIHATRYLDETHGGRIIWRKRPEAIVNDRTVLVIDDILDEGITLRTIVDACRTAGARDIYTAVLADKQTGREKRFPRADFTGLTVPDRYVFGYGMDYKGYLRNCPGIYAVRN